MNVIVEEPDGSFADVDLKSVTPPARSSLISLKPINRGTGLVESMWSYLQRLADAHTVRFLDLITMYLSPFSDRLFTPGKGSVGKGDWPHFIRSINGASSGVRLAPVLQELTLQGGLEQLTLGPVTATIGLDVRTRMRRAWCPRCLASDRIPYQRLLWEISGASHCSEHGAALAERCPGCGSYQPYFSATTDIRSCTKCGHSLASASDVVGGHTADEFGSWGSKQLVHLLVAAQARSLETKRPEVRLHNLTTSSQLPQIGGITCFAKKIGFGRNTAWYWLNQGGRLRLIPALRWAWLVNVDLPRLFSEKLSASDLVFRPLPEKTPVRTPVFRCKPVPTNSPALYLAALRLSSKNPFRAPKIDELVKASGIHEKHEAFRAPCFVRLLRGLRERERIFHRKERIWREICDVHSASIELIAAGHRLTRARIGSRMKNPSHLASPLARSYSAWFKRRHRAGDLAVRNPKKIPLDVRAYWQLSNYRETDRTAE